MAENDNLTKEKKMKMLKWLLLGVGVVASLMGIVGLLFPFEETGFIAHAFRWEPYNEPYERMILMIFLAMGICMILASRKPEKHLLIVLFVILHGFLHGGVMLFDSFARPHELAHLVGDVPMLIGIGVLFSLVMPWGDFMKSL